MINDWLRRGNRRYRRKNCQRAGSPLTPAAISALLPPRQTQETQQAGTEQPRGGRDRNGGYALEVKVEVETAIESIEKRTTCYHRYTQSAIAVIIGRSERKYGVGVVTRYVGRTGPEAVLCGRVRQSGAAI